MPPHTRASKPASARPKLMLFRAPHELCRRLYVPGQGSALESIGVPHYLPTKINCWNELDKAGFLHLHHSVLNKLLHDNICITGESCDDPQVACCALYSSCDLRSAAKWTADTSCCLLFIAQLLRPEVGGEAGWRHAVGSQV